MQAEELSRIKPVSLLACDRLHRAVAVDSAGICRVLQIIPFDVVEIVLIRRYAGSVPYRLGEAI
jgi:hypothetical protein